RSRARLELPNLSHYVDFTKAAGNNEVGKAVKEFKQIAEGSMYRDKARIAYEKMRASFVDNQENEARAYVRSGRCDEARRAAGIAAEWSPDGRGRMDAAASGCRPARGASDSAAEVATRDTRAEEKQAAAPVPMAAPVPPVPLPSAQPTAMSNEAPKAMPEPPKALAAAPVQPPAPARVLTAEAPPPGPPTSP